MAAAPDNGDGYFCIFTPMFRIRYIAIALAAFVFEGCTCCAYLNHMFNAERLYDEATEMRTARLDSVPDAEASSPSSEERH